MEHMLKARNGDGLILSTVECNWRTIIRVKHGLHILKDSLAAVKRFHDGKVQSNSKADRGK